MRKRDVAPCYRSFLNAAVGSSRSSVPRKNAARCAVTASQDSRSRPVEAALDIVDPRLKAGESALKIGEALVVKDDNIVNYRDDVGDAGCGLATRVCRAMSRNRSRMRARSALRFSTEDMRISLGWLIAIAGSGVTRPVSARPPLSLSERPWVPISRQSPAAHRQPGQPSLRPRGRYRAPRRRAAVPPWAVPAGRNG